MNLKYRRHHRTRHRLGIPRHLSETKCPFLAPQASFSLSLFQEDRVESEQAKDFRTEQAKQEEAETRGSR